MLSHTCTTSKLAIDDRNLRRNPLVNSIQLPKTDVVIANTWRGRLVIVDKPSGSIEYELENIGAGVFSQPPYTTQYITWGQKKDWKPHFNSGRTNFCSKRAPVRQSKPHLEPHQRGEEDGNI